MVAVVAVALIAAVVVIVATAAGTQSSTAAPQEFPKQTPRQTAATVTETPAPEPPVIPEPSIIPELTTDRPTQDPILDEPQSLYEQWLESGYVSDLIPISYDLQAEVRLAAMQFEVPYELVYAVMFRESSYKLDAVSANGKCYGLMQVNKCNFEWLHEELADYGVTDIPGKPEDNIKAGTYILGLMLQRYGDEHKALMAYNCGETTAKKLWSQGYQTSGYSRSVMETYEELLAALPK